MFIRFKSEEETERRDALASRSRVESGRRGTRNLPFPPVQSQLGDLPQLITAIVTSLCGWKTISMITRTNKISNCYHPSHLPPLSKCEGAGRGRLGGNRGLPPRFKGKVVGMMVKN